MRNNPGVNPLSGARLGPSRKAPAGKFAAMKPPRRSMSAATAERCARGIDSRAMRPPREATRHAAMARAAANAERVLFNFAFILRTTGAEMGCNPR